MIRLTKRQILKLHSQLIEETGGSSGLRDEGLLESALEAPFQTYGDQDLPDGYMPVRQLQILT